MTEEIAIAIRNKDRNIFDNTLLEIDSDMNYLMLVENVVESLQWGRYSQKMIDLTYMQNILGVYPLQNILQAMSTMPKRNLPSPPVVAVLLTYIDDSQVSMLKSIYSGNLEVLVAGIVTDVLSRPDIKNRFGTGDVYNVLSSLYFHFGDEVLVPVSNIIKHLC